MNKRFGANTLPSLRTTCSAGSLRRFWSRAFCEVTENCHRFQMEYTSRQLIRHIEGAIADSPFFIDRTLDTSRWPM